MITVSDYNKEQLIVVEPNRSASWNQNKILIGILGCWCLLIACAFALIGAWMILPFAGIEIAALLAGCYSVCWNLHRRHVLRFCEDGVTIEKGRLLPNQVWHFSKHHTSISVERRDHPWDPLKIFLCSRDHQGAIELIAIGDFLNKDDSTQLLKVLRQRGLAVLNDSHAGAIEL